MRAPQKDRVKREEKRMKTRTPKILYGFVMLASIFLCQESFAGAIIHQLAWDKDGKSSKTVLYISGEKLRTDDEEGGLTTVMDFKGDRMFMIDHRAKRYVETKFSGWEKEVAARLKEDNPSPETQVRKITVRKTGEKTSINGFQTEKVQVLADGELIEENWMTQQVDMKEIGKVLEKVATGFAREFRVEMKEGREIYEKLKPFGFPVMVKDYGSSYGLGGMKVSEVKKVEYKDLKDDVFLPPQGYERVIPESSPKK